MTEKMKFSDTKIRPGIPSEDNSVCKFVEYPKLVGGYRLGKHNYYIYFPLTVKPSWLHRTMMKICFGFIWVDSID